MNFLNYPVTTIFTDVLIIGGGGAGCMAAIRARMHGDVSVAMVEKGVIGASGCTVMGTYSCCAALGHAEPRDNPRIHFEDTFSGGAEIGDKTLLTRFVEEAPARVMELVEYGVPFEKEGNRLKQAAMPGHTYPRACFVGNRTGQAIQWGLRKKLRQSPGIRRYNDIQVYRLLHRDGCVHGAAGFCRKTLTPIRFLSKATVLATGGCGQLYPHTSTSLDNTGDGISMAFAAGAALMDMEFMQFNPVCYIYPRLIGLNRTQTRFLRFVRGSRMVNRLGQDFVAEKYPDWKHSLTRDRLSRLIYQEIQEGRGTERGGVYIDLSRCSDTDIAEALSVGNFRKKIGQMGIDLKKTRFEVGPASHYFMGGIRVDENAQSSLSGLFAAGEAIAGIHGANRLGGNALSEILVTGAIAGQGAAQHARNQSQKTPEFKRVTEWEAWISGLCSQTDPGPVPSELRKRFQHIMWVQGGIIRSGAGIKKGLSELIPLMKASRQDLTLSTEPAPYHLELQDAVEVRLMLDLCRIMLTVADRREESRGSHFREDFPEQNPTWQTHLIVTRKGDNLHCEKRS